jgi:hypothetical protein
VWHGRVVEALACSCSVRTRLSNDLPFEVKSPAMLWVHDWEFCRELDCLRRPDRVVILRDRSSALQWLQQFKEDDFKMRSMRTFLSHEHSARQFSNLSDEAIIDQIVGLLISRRLHIHALFEQTPPSGIPGEIETVKFAPSPRKALPAGPAPVSDPSTFSDIDGPAQAATLAAAADSGKPFCPE